MYATLGNIVFENLKSFNDFSNSGSASYAEHSLLDGKPVLQKTGNGLDEINLSLRLHVSFCNPGAELSALLDYRNNGEVLPLLYGSGVLAGNYVITQLSYSIEDADAQANVFSYLVSLSLKEYVIKDRLQAEQESNRKNAIAAGDKKPVAKKKTNPPTCPQSVSSIISSIDNHAKAINIIVEQKGGGTTPENRNAMKGHLASISKQCGYLLEKDANPDSCVKAYPEIGVRAASVRGECTVFSLDISNSPERIPNDNNLLKAKVAALKTAARPLVNTAITNKG